MILIETGANRLVFLKKYNTFDVIFQTSSLVAFIWRNDALFNFLL